MNQIFNHVLQYVLIVTFFNFESTITQELCHHHFSGDLTDNHLLQFLLLLEDFWIVANRWFVFSARQNNTNKVRHKAEKHL